MKNILMICVFLTGVLLTGCENNEILLSEKKLNSELKGTWKIVSPRPSSDFVESWTFSGGVITIASNSILPSGPTMNVTGRYSVDAKFAKAYINISGFTYTGQLNSNFMAPVLNRKWTLVELNDGVLYVSATDDAGAIRSIEFVKM